MTFVTLPASVHLELFRHLDKVTSTCLGLTCKAFWKLHRAINGRAWLWEVSPRGPQTFGIPLHELLESWMPFGLVYGEQFFPGKFVAMEKHSKAKKAHDQDIKNYLAATTPEEMRQILKPKIRSPRGFFLGRP